MKRYFTNLMVALLGRDPYQMELAQAREECELTAKRVQQLEAEVAESKEKQADDKKRIAGYQNLTENLQKRVTGKIIEAARQAYEPELTAEITTVSPKKAAEFTCERSFNAHIERKKSKMSFHLDHKPTRQEEKEIERRMCELIDEDLPVTFEFVTRDELPEEISLDRLPDDASETIRLVRIGDYDVCPCIGKHVRSTSQIGRFEMLGTNWDEHERSFRVRFKIV